MKIARDKHTKSAKETEKLKKILANKQRPVHQLRKIRTKKKKTTTNKRTKKNPYQINFCSF